ncbi:rna-directed dna polymerase from mobile element jockey-like [Willisornis vidua]|uniref:Rna-directed dna polymerase from mobile element jockey-like n=1 Tax=Willisornis vidua TaxID=1566151 RepID=A0ABQ9D0C6_9PASS|nr:rna-directed dna polymerase from mobile element jockey-like [Willisornis vidua]
MTFHPFINVIDSEIKCTLGKFADDTKLSDTSDMPRKWDAIQSNLNKLKKYLMEFNKAKCKVLHVGWGDLWYSYILEDKWIESSPDKKDLLVLVDEKLDLKWKCALAITKPVVHWTATKEEQPAG